MACATHSLHRFYHDHHIDTDTQPRRGCRSHALPESDEPGRATTGRLTNMPWGGNQLAFNRQCEVAVAFQEVCLNIVLERKKGSDRRCNPIIIYRACVGCYGGEGTENS